MEPEANTADPMAGRRIGHYRLLRRLGEGGMGVVYQAEREDEFRQRVAVKLVRQAFAGPEVLRRFHTERQTLAGLAHPHIVTLIDGGTTEEGAPYLVMEYVEGARIDEYCAARRLPVAERLRLFLPVCAAVEYAHRNLVVHCDLKPANILITAEGAPKLLDFGIAKLVAPAVTGELTQAGQRPFTPNYASPEQVRGEPVTTLTDVYALGLILYELVAGRSAYRMESGSAAEMVAAVCVQEPERPSATGAQVDGDLDAIVLKALRKEPQHRYGSAQQLAEDIKRYLEGRPVAARAGTLRYRAKKFVLRNRVAVAAAALALAAVLAGVIGVAWQAGVALAARARAERRFNDVRKLTSFLLFDFHDAVEKLPGSTPVQEMLVTRSLKYLDSLAAEAAGDPGLRLELVEAYTKFGDVQGNPYQPNLGDTEGALASYRKALAIAETLAGDRRAERARARVHLHTGDVLFLLRRMPEATATARQGLAILEKLIETGAGDADTRMDLAGGYEGLGDQLSKGLSDRAGALESYRKSLGHWEEAARLEPQNMRARRAQAGLNMKLADLASETDPRGALERHRQGLGVLEALPAAEQAAVATRRLAASLQRRIADCQWELDDLKGALESYRKASEAFSALAALDPANSRAQFDLAVVLNNAGQILEAEKDLAGALRHYGQVADTLERLIRSDAANPSWRAHYAEALVRIGGLLKKTGQTVEARRQTARGLAAAKELAGKPGTPAGELTRAARLLAICEPAELRDPQAAVRYAERAVELTSGADAYALDTLAEAHLQSGNREAARAAIERGLRLVPPAASGQPTPWLRRLLEGKLARL
ncbi:MAG: protein kinase, partial [Acidobacteriota bacterium]